MTWVWPVELVHITSPFDLKRKHPISGVVKPHNGTDFRAPTGTPIYAVHSGTVTLSGWNNVAGNWVWVAHEGGYRTQYHHLSKRHVVAGQRVYEGQQVGLAGATGQVAGAHLHFEVRHQGVPIDPVPFLRGRVKPPKIDPPIPEPEPEGKDTDMQIMIRQEEAGQPMYGQVSLLAGDLIIPVINETVWKRFEAVGVKTVNVPYAQYRQFVNLAAVGA